MPKTVIDSHIQMPKGILKQFVDKYHAQYIYDFISPWVKKAHPKSVNTQKGYYSTEIEKFLDANIEAPLGKLISELESESYQPQQRHVDLDLLAKRYLRSLICRSQSMLDRMGKNSVYLQFCPEQDAHDLTVINNYNAANSLNLFGETLVTILDNRTSTPFVLPLCGHYSCRFDQAPCIVLPLTKQHALVLIYECAAKDFICENGIKSRLCVVSEDTIDRLNQQAFVYEQDQNRRGVVSNDRSYLSRLVETVMAKTT